MLAVRAAATLCGANVEGLELRSTALKFVPSTLICGCHEFDVGTAGSVVLVLQAVLRVIPKSGVTPTLLPHYEHWHLRVTKNLDRL